MKPLGWRGESYRHYLAAKGYRTRYTAKILPGDEWRHTRKHFGKLDEAERQKTLAQLNTNLAELQKKWAWAKMYDDEISMDSLNEEITDVEDQIEELKQSDYFSKKYFSMKVKWSPPRLGDKVEWWTPDEYLKATGGLTEWDTDYHDTQEGGFHPISKLRDKMGGGAVIEPVELWNDVEGLTHQQGRHRAYAARMLGEDRIPVVVERKQ